MADGSGPALKELREEHLLQPKQRQEQLRQRRHNLVINKGLVTRPLLIEEAPELADPNGYIPVPGEEVIVTAAQKQSMFQAKLPQQEWRSIGRDVLQSDRFQGAMGALIMANALVIGLETDVTWWPYWDLVENTFLLLFFVELVMKIVMYGIPAFFHTMNEHVHWNVFDCFIVGLGVADLIFAMVGADSGHAEMLFRIIRLLRTLRIIRLVKFLKQLYLLAFGLAEAAQAVFWVTILMTFVLYVCAIVMVKTCGRPDEDDENFEFLHGHFGGVVISMLTLFELMSSPDFTPYQAEPGLIASRPLLALFLIGFIIFGSFGMIALLTGIISESMFEKNELRKEEERMEQEAMREAMQEELEHIFDGLETNELGEADEAAVLNLVPQIAQLFEENWVNFVKADITTCIELLDTREVGKITKSAFVHGVLTLAEEVRPLSILEIHHDAHIVRQHVEELDRRHERMEQMMHALVLHAGMKVNTVQNGHSTTTCVHPNETIYHNGEEVHHVSVMGSHLYFPIDMEDGVMQFHDAKYTLKFIPEMLRDTTLFQGPCRHVPGDEIKVKAPAGTIVYLLVSRGNLPENKSALNDYIISLGGWFCTEVGMRTTSFSRPGFVVYRKEISSDEPLILTINVLIEVSVALKLHETYGSARRSNSKERGATKGTAGKKVEVAMPLPTAKLVGGGAADRLEARRQLRVGVDPADVGRI